MRCNDHQKHGRLLGMNATEASMVGLMVEHSVMPSGLE